MLKKISVSLLLFLNCVYLNAQWTPKLSSKGLNSLIIKQIYYLNDYEAYASSGSGYLYHTLNDWKDFEQISNNIPITDDIQYLEMTSRTHGTVVTRQMYSFGSDSTFIYTTENGGYKWTKAFTLPIPKPSNSWPIGGDKIFFQRKNNKLYILFGDIICHGKINSQSWKSVRIPMQRETFNSGFHVYTDSLWNFQNSSFKIYTNNQGFNWNYDVTEPNLYELNSSLGNSIQRLSNFDQDRVSIEDYDAKEKKWNLISSRPGSGVIRNAIQLSENYLLVSLIEFSNFNLTIHTIFDMKKRVWLDLISLSEFFDLKEWYIKGDNFVRISDDGRIMQSEDFGQTWQPVSESLAKQEFDPDFLNFDKNMGVSLSKWGNLTFSTDSGESWRFISNVELTKIIKPENSFSLNYDINSGLYLMSDKTKKIVPTKDSFQLIDVNFKYNLNPIICDNVSDNGSDNFYVIGVVKDSFYLFKSNESGNLSKLFSHKDFTRNGHRDRLLIQNNNYVVFCVERSIYAFEKKSGIITLLTDSNYNSFYSLEFANEDKLIAGAYISYFIYDFKTKEAKETIQNNKEIETYGIFRSLASNGNGELGFVNFNVLYKTTIEDLENLSLDQSFKSDSYIDMIRYWNGHYWIGTYWNVYKNENPKATVLPCFEIKSVWPNPFYEQFNLDVLVGSQANLSLLIYNSLGMLVYQSEENLDTGLYDRTPNIDKLSKGIYYLKIKSECGSKTLKLLHQ